MAVKQSQGDLATKQDTALLKSDTAQLRSELKADIAQLRSELKADIAQLRSELKADIAQLRSDNTMMTWGIGVNIALSVGIFATVISGFIALMPSP